MSFRHGRLSLTRTLPKRYLHQLVRTCPMTPTFDYSSVEQPFRRRLEAAVKHMRYWQGRAVEGFLASSEVLDLLRLGMVPEHVSPERYAEWMWAEFCMDAQTLRPYQRAVKISRVAVASILPLHTILDLTGDSTSEAVFSQIRAAFGSREFLTAHSIKAMIRNAQNASLRS